MTTIPIGTARSYNVHIGYGLLAQSGTLLRQLAPAARRVVVVCDDNVAPLYTQAVAQALQTADFDCLHFIFPAGENSKNMDTLSHLLEFLARNGVEKSDIIAALGGGVTGDLAGFAASLYRRRLNFIQLPTTLLAAIDSSVGGKTAVNLVSGKNLAGTFHQPLAVICDCDTFATFPPAVLADGMGEAVKYGILADPDLLQKLPQLPLPQLVARCVAIKQDFVRGDERDTGIRQLLNFGHTAAHAIEACSGFSISHGHAVAAGMCIMARAAEQHGIAATGTAQTIRQALLQFHLPVNTDFTASQLAQAALRDKKRAGNQITLVLPQRIGCCILQRLPLAQLTDFIALGLEE